jgi:hypothetical protein
MIGTSRALSGRSAFELAFLFRVSALSRLLSAFRVLNTEVLERQDEAEQSVPRYHRIAETLRERIRGGELASGARLDNQRHSRRASA